MTLPSELLPVGLLGATAAATPTGYQVSRSLRFNSADSAYLNRTPASAGNRRTWTWSGWLKFSNLTSSYGIFAAPFQSGSNTLTDSFEVWYSAGTLHLTDQSVYYFSSAAIFRDPTAWQHFTFACDTTQATASNRFKVYQNGVLLTNTAGGTITQNLDTAINKTVLQTIGEWRGTYANDYLAEVHFIDGQALTPSSFTATDATTGQLIPKAYTGSYGTNGFKLNFSDNSTVAALGTDSSGAGNTWTVNNISPGTTSNAQPRWYSSSTLYYTKADILANATDRGTGSFTTTAGGEYVYIVVNNGAYLGTDNVFSGYFPVILNVFYNTSGTYVTQTSYNTSEGPNFDWVNGTPGYTVLSNDVDFHAFAVNRSGDTPTGVFYSNTFPALITTGFRTAGAVNRGNDSLVDTPTSYGTDTGVGGEVRGNYATLNPLYGGPIPTNGNLDVSLSVQSSYATISFTTSKWYWELTATAAITSGYVGVMDSTYVKTDNNWSSQARSYVADGNKFNGSTSAYGASWANGDVIGVAVDMDAGTIVFYKNGASQGTAFSDLSGKEWRPFIYATAGSYTTNFGQRAFAYTAPSGFKALCDTNLPTPVIAKPNTVMDVKLYTGNGGTQSITGLNFSPDLVWIKVRSTSYDHRLFDTVRPLNAKIITNSTSAEISTTVNDNFTAFNSDGFSLGSTSSTNGSNFNGEPYVAWAWDAGTSTVTNTAGSISSQVRANASAGFSVITYTGTGANATVGHGLGIAPSMVIVKQRSGTFTWRVYHASLANTQVLYLSATDAATTETTAWNSTTPTSSVVSLGTGGGVNGSSDTYVAYCFAPVSGYSSFGSYTGNGSADGPFVYTGMRPQFILLKRSSGVNNWVMWDTSRNTYNAVNNILFSNSANAAYTGAPSIDILSNGFKIRDTANDSNFNGDTYVYAAFAESPFQYARAR